MTQEDLLSQCFYYLNSFKRHRALEQIKKLDGKNQDVQYHQLKQYQFLDSLELGLRAIQKGTRLLGEEEVQC
jgi:uncharacterized protein YnzC (UPF0291/DUF896 family)